MNHPNTGAAHVVGIEVGEASAGPGLWPVTVLMSDGAGYGSTVDSLELLEDYLDYAQLTDDDVQYLGLSRSQLVRADRRGRRSARVADSRRPPPATASRQHHQHQEAGGRPQGEHQGPCLR